MFREFCVCKGFGELRLNLDRERQVLNLFGVYHIYSLSWRLYRMATCWFWQRCISEFLWLIVLNFQFLSFFSLSEHVEILFGAQTDLLNHCFHGNELYNLSGLVLILCRFSNYNKFLIVHDFEIGCISFLISSSYYKD